MQGAFRRTYSRKRMARFHKPWLALSLAAIFIAACDSAATPTQQPPTQQPPTQQPPTQQPPTQQPPTPTLVPTLPTTSAPSLEPTDVATATATETTAVTGTTGPTSQPVTDGTRIRVTFGGTVLIGRLWDNATARDLIAQLPLTLTFSDFNGVEKIARVPRELSREGVPAGDDPLPRDIGYYAPSRDLVFYYDEVGYFNGIVRIGQFDGSVDAIASQTADFTARIELAP
jgi:hypothetical protein